MPNKQRKARARAFFYPFLAHKSLENDRFCIKILKNGFAVCRVFRLLKKGRKFGILSFPRRPCITLAPEKVDSNYAQKGMAVPDNALKPQIRTGPCGISPIMAIFVETAHVPPGTAHVPPGTAHVPPGPPMYLLRRTRPWLCVCFVRCTIFENSGRRPGQVPLWPHREYGPDFVRRFLNNRPKYSLQL